MVRTHVEEFVVFLDHEICAVVLACDPFEELVVGRLGDDNFHTGHAVVDLNVSGRAVSGSNDWLSLGVNAEVGRIKSVLLENPLI